jgi:hypothetical protein
VQKKFFSSSNFGTYVLLYLGLGGSAENFLSNTFLFSKRNNEQFTVYLNSAEWFVGRNTTFSENVNLDPDKPVIVLTRASIRLRKLWSFGAK